MPIYLLILGVLIGLMVTVPVGPLGLLCISRALALGPWCGLSSGLGVATADALAAFIAALGISLVSGFLSDHQTVLRLIAGVFLCCTGFRIFTTQPVQQTAKTGTVNGVLGSYASTFLLTFSNPITFLSFFAIYAGWHVESLSGNYLGAAILTVGIFLGSSLWWIALFIGLTAFRDKFNLRVLWWIHRVSGAAISGLGIVLLLSLGPLSSLWGV